MAIYGLLRKMPTAIYGSVPTAAVLQYMNLLLVNGLYTPRRTAGCPAIKYNACIATTKEKCGSARLADWLRLMRINTCSPFFLKKTVCKTPWFIKLWKMQQVNYGYRPIQVSAGSTRVQKAFGTSLI